MTDSPENQELTPAEKILFAAAQVLDNAGAPRTDTERDGIGINIELNLAGRILWLVEQRNDKELAREREAKEANRWSGEARQLRSDVERASAILAQHGAPMDELMVYQGAEWLGRELAAQRERADKAESNLSETHVNLRQVLGAESIAEAFELITGLQAKVEELSQRYNRAADELQALTEQRDKATTTALSAADNAGELATENLRLERLVRQLTGKVKRREADIERYRAELAKKPARAKPKTRRRS